MTSTPPERPRVLAGRYEVGRLLGAGGMAEVFEGHDRLLNRRVAIKVLLSHYARDPAFLARFKREAQAAASLSHPNIVGVYDTGVQDSTHFIVMEYVQGRPLRDAIRQEGPLLPERAAEIAHDVCAALAAAHARGLIHRDIKPGNIMLTPDGTVKVMDFGIARAVSGETITQTHAVVGTAQYISPEQAQGMPVDPRSDLYSLGCCLYEMLTGQVPFSGSTPVAIAYRHVREQPVPPRRLNPDIPPALDAVCLKLLAKRPEERYQTAVELQRDLARVLAGQQPLLGGTRPTQTTQAISAGTLSSQPTIAMRTGVGEQPTQMLNRASVPATTEAYPGAYPGTYPDGGAQERGRPWGWVLLAIGALLVAGVLAFLVAQNLGGELEAPQTTAPTLPAFTTTTEEQTTTTQLQTTTTQERTTTTEEQQQTTTTQERTTTTEEQQQTTTTQERTTTTTNQEQQTTTTSG